MLEPDIIQSIYPLNYHQMYQLDINQYNSQKFNLYSNLLDIILSSYELCYLDSFIQDNFVHICLPQLINQQNSLKNKR